MKHRGTVWLETERLILRRFTPADAETAYRNYFLIQDSIWAAVLSAPFLKVR